MSTDLQYSPGNDHETPQQGGDPKKDTQQDVNISLPRTERPEGPFEHSGETSGQTKAEQAEENQSADDSSS